jgi:transposase
VRARIERIDWKYALGLELTDVGLELTDVGFHCSALSEFRTRLVEGSLEYVLLDRLLERCRERGWLKARGRQRTDSTHVVGAVRALKSTRACRRDAARDAQRAGNRGARLAQGAGPARLG